MTCTAAAFAPPVNDAGKASFTFETWLYIDEWTEGAFLLRKQNAAATKGFSIRLGTEADHQLIVRCNGNDYVYSKALQTRRWVHVAVMSGSATTAANNFSCYVSGTLRTPDADLSSTAVGNVPQGADAEPVYIGENLRGELDETAIWHTTFGSDDLSDHRNNKMPMPGPGTRVSVQQMGNAVAV